MLGSGQLFPSEGDHKGQSGHSYTEAPGSLPVYETDSQSNQIGRFSFIWIKVKAFWILR